MLNKKRIIFYSVSLIIFCLILLIPGMVDYFEYRQAAEAAASMPWVDGGKITKVMPLCILDTPPIAPVDCDISCPLLSPILKALCMEPLAEALSCIAVAQEPTSECAVPIAKAVECIGCYKYTELTVVGQKGTFVVGVPAVPPFIYKGGGTFPVAGTDFIAGGSSNIHPWVVGIPGAAARRTQKLVDAGKYIIALFK